MAYILADDGSLDFATGGSTVRMRIGSNGNIGQAVSPITDPYVAASEQWMTYQIGKAGVLGAYKNNNESMFGFNTYVSAPSGVNKAIISGIGDNIHAAIAKLCTNIMHLLYYLCNSAKYCKR